MISVTNIRELYTMASTPDNPCGVMRDAALLIEDGLISWMGPEKNLPKNMGTADNIDAEGRIVTPGFIDCHTHLIFAGNRSLEFYLRSQGASYGEILKAGGGIVSTMKAVRDTSVDELVALARPRLARMLARGVTTIEAKSGYGLCTESEVKMLEALRILDADGPIHIIGTFLGAHAVPPEFRGRRTAYVDLIMEDMLPAVKAHGFATFCDVFIEDGAFSVDNGRRILVRAQNLGLRSRIHAEQLTHQGATALACEIGAVSASHLEHIDEGDIALLAQCGVVAELLPIAQEFLGMKTLAPARAMADAGVLVAIATDFNPGSAMCDDLLLAARLAVTRSGLTCEEALAGITTHAAKALGRGDIGVIQKGNKADLCFLDGENLWQLFYDWSLNPVKFVMKFGELVHRN